MHRASRGHLISACNNHPVDTQIAIAIIANLVTVAVLIVTQYFNQRNEKRRLDEGRVSRLADARRMSYLKLLQVCDDFVHRTDMAQFDPPEPAPADTHPEFEGVITRSLQEPLIDVEITGEKATVNAARKLVKVVNDYLYYETSQARAEIPAAREAFTTAARRDLGSYN